MRLADTKLGTRTHTPLCYNCCFLLHPTDDLDSTVLQLNMGELWMITGLPLFHHGVQLSRAHQ